MKTKILEELLLSFGRMGVRDAKLNVWSAICHSAEETYAAPQQKHTKNYRVLLEVLSVLDHQQWTTMFHSMKSLDAPLMSSVTWSAIRSSLGLPALDWSDDDNPVVRVAFSLFREAISKWLNSPT